MNPSPPVLQPSRSPDRALDAVNFFLADVRDGLGPYLAIYLLAVHKWEPASIGAVMTVAGLAALVAQTPAGALIDRVNGKRATIVIAAILVTVSCLVLPWTASFTLVALTQALGAIAGTVFAPAIAAISLGIGGPRVFARRMGRMKRSIMRAMPSRRCWPAGWPMWAGPWWCST